LFIDDQFILELYAAFPGRRRGEGSDAAQLFENYSRGGVAVIAQREGDVIAGIKGLVMGPTFWAVPGLD